MSVIGTLISEIELGLDVALPAEVVPVRWPGSPIGGLPCVQIALADMPAPLADGRVLVHTADVVVIVSRDNAPEQIERLEALTDTVVRILLDAGHPITSSIRAVGGDAEDVHYIGRRIPIEAGHSVLC